MDALPEPKKIKPLPRKIVIMKMGLIDWLMGIFVLMIYGIIVYDLVFTMNRRYPTLYWAGWLMWAIYLVSSLLWLSQSAEEEKQI